MRSSSQVVPTLATAAALDVPLRPTHLALVAGLATGTTSFPLFALTGLLLASALSLVAEGGGGAQRRPRLAERAHRKAIEEGPIWTRPPYVAR